MVYTFKEVVKENQKKVKITGHIQSIGFLFLKIQTTTQVANHLKCINCGSTYGGTSMALIIFIPYYKNSEKLDLFMSHFYFYFF